MNRGPIDPSSSHSSSSVSRDAASQASASSDACSDIQTSQSSSAVTHDEWTIRDWQQQVDQWIRTLGVRYFSEMTNLAQLMEEVGELARLISRTYVEQSFKAGESTQNLADEMADVLFVLTCLANQTGVDLQQALAANLAKKSNRDATRHLQNSKLHQHTSE